MGSALSVTSLAAALGLPFAFASHFAPGDLDQAVQLYRDRFQPGPWGDAPRFMLAVNVFAADTDEAARKLRTSQQQSFYRLRTGAPGKLPPPVDDLSQVVPAQYHPTLDAALRVSAVGSPASVKRQLDEFAASYRPDEMILTGMIHDPEARLRSFAIAAEVMG